MGLLDMLRGGVDDIGGLLGRLTSTPAPQASPLEQAGGVDPTQAQNDYRTNYAIAVANAARSGRGWWDGPLVAKQQAQQAYDADIAKTATQVQQIKSARETAEARGRMRKLVMEGVEGLTPAQNELLRALPDDQLAPVMSKIAEQKATSAQHRYTVQPVGDGVLSVTDNQTGKTEFRSAPQRAFGGGTTPGAGGKASGASVGTGDEYDPVPSILSRDVNGMFTLKQPGDILAPPPGWQPGRRLTPGEARTVRSLQGAVEHDTILKDLNVRTNEHANIVANVNSPDVTPQDRANKDVSLLFMFAHMLNPSVSVHENSLELLKQSTAAFDRLGVKVDRVMNGQQLTPEQRQSILRESGVMAHGSMSIGRNRLAGFADQARLMGLHPALILKDPTGGIDFGDESGTLRPKDAAPGDNPLYKRLGINPVGAGK